MNNFLCVNYQNLNRDEKSVLAIISVLPISWYSVKDLFVYVDIHCGSDEGVRFFDHLHGLVSKGWLNFTNGFYRISDTAKTFIKQLNISEQSYLRRLIENVNLYFAKSQRIGRHHVYEYIAAEILDKINLPSKKLALLAKNFSKYCLGFRNKNMALKYSNMAVDIQEKVDIYDVDMCTIYAEKAAVLNSTGNYNEAIAVGNKCLTACVKHGNQNKTKTYALELCYGVMSTAFERLNDYKKSLLCALKAIEIGCNNRNYGVYEQAVSFYNAAISYYKRGEYSKARFYIIKAYVEYCNEHGAKPSFFSKWNIRRMYYCIVYRINYLLLRLKI